MSWVMYSNDVWENAGNQTYTPQVATSTASRCHWFTIESGLHPTPSRCLVRRLFPIEKTPWFFVDLVHKKKHWHKYTSFCWEILKGMTLPFLFDQWYLFRPFGQVTILLNPQGFLSGLCCSCFCSFLQICHVR